MPWLILAVVFTLATSFVCSLLEALVLSTTVADVEALKKSHPKRGLLLEQIRYDIDETISAVLTLNTIAMSVGSMVIGALGAHLFGDRMLAVFSAAFGAVLLVCAEVLPKNMAVAYRRTLQPYGIYPLGWLRKIFLPITAVSNAIVRLVVPKGRPAHASEEEIILLAEHGARHGTLTKSESNLITNALSLDDVRVSEIMTPRTVVSALRRSATVGEVFREFPNLPFGRVPVYGRNLDDIVGLVRRRDLLKAKANDQDGATVESLMIEAHFVPDTATVANALQSILKVHQKLLVAVDEFGATAGVVTMEDIMEHLIGGEIFEKDDVAVDMRELARTQQQQRRAKPKRAAAEPSPPASNKS